MSKEFRETGYHPSRLRKIARDVEQRAKSALYARIHSQETRRTYKAAMYACVRFLKQELFPIEYADTYSENPFLAELDYLAKLNTIFSPRSPHPERAQAIAQRFFDTVSVFPKTRALKISPKFREQITGGEITVVQEAGVDIGRMIEIRAHDKSTLQVVYRENQGIELVFIDIQHNQKTSNLSYRDRDQQRDLMEAVTELAAELEAARRVDWLRARLTEIATLNPWNWQQVDKILEESMAVASHIITLGTTPQQFQSQKEFSQEQRLRAFMESQYPHAARERQLVPFGIQQSEFGLLFAVFHALRNTSQICVEHPESVAPETDLWHLHYAAGFLIDQARVGTWFLRMEHEYVRTYIAQRTQHDNSSGEAMIAQELPDPLQAFFQTYIATLPAKSLDQIRTEIPLALDILQTTHTQANLPLLAIRTNLIHELTQRVLQDPSHPQITEQVIQDRARQLTDLPDWQRPIVALYDFACS